MNKIANGFFLTFFFLIATATIINAGILESLDNELTGLVEKAEPYLVTVEARGDTPNRAFVGSGTLIDQDGHVLTTTSVIGKSDNIKVSFKNGEEYNAAIIGTDYHSGLALLKIKPLDRQSPKFGDPKNLRDGSWIIVIGNCYDIPNSVDFGVFSGFTDEGFMQLSVQSGPGSSGSAIFNTKGEMIGVLIAQATETVSFNLTNDNYIKVKTNKYGLTEPQNPGSLDIDLPTVGTSLALPVDKIRHITDQLKKNGVVEHGFLGIRQKSLSSKIRLVFNIDNGVIVVSTTKDSPAERGGVARNDIITRFDGIKVKGPEHFYSLVRSHMPGDKIEVEVIRDSSKVKLDVVLGRAPDEGYYGFLQNQSRTVRDQENVSPSTRGLANKLDIIKDQVSQLDGIKDVEIKIDIEELENKMIELEDHLDKLANKINDLSKKLENK
ncbi:MAG: PDZ domain-containing protein [candidate division Zixibacteria bacterium]|nr:PDZ domain-containing protein [candidate division Zixibacteria bacterium]